MMVRKLQILSAIALLFLFSNSYAGLPVSVNGQQLPSLAPMLKQVMPAVVNISASGKTQVRASISNNPLLERLLNIQGVKREKIIKSLGSGVIVDADKGYVITNNHVIDNAFEITVTLSDGRELYAEVIGKDPETDIAVIKIKPGLLSQLSFADSNQLEVGDFVVAIGNPFGLGQTVTSGIVSALGRSGLGIESYEDFIQTDASINLGSSGGALVNLNGKLVGINTAILGSSSNSNGNIGIGFAIPINMASDIMLQLIEYGEVKRGHLGVQGQDLSVKLATALNLNPTQQGVVITQIEAGTSAFQAGLKIGDVITHANSKKISTTTDMFNLVGLLRINQKVILNIIRNGQPLKLVLTVQDIQIPEIDGVDLARQLYSVVLGEVSKSDLTQGESNQIVITSIAKGSQAWQAGLREKDVIYAINKYQVNTLDDLELLFKNKLNVVLLQVIRDKRSLLILLR